MAGKIEETLLGQAEQDSLDPWAAAFAALDKKDEEDVEGASVPSGDGVPSVDDSDSEKPDLGAGSIEAKDRDGTGFEDVAGGPGDLGGTDSSEDGGLDWDDIDISEESIKSYRDELTQTVHQQVLQDVAAAYVKRGARNTNGRLGASINDPDVCKRDHDGVPRFYNPETGREFTGDNPRRQAQEWVDDYNRELADAFNQTCAEYENQLMQQQGHKLAVIEFAPKYKRLDAVRKAMFDSIVEDYEITDDDGNVVGYSCDLDKALAAVDRQVAVIRRKFAGQASQPKPEPSGPVLDTPSTNGTQGGNAKPQFKSIAEAMEWEQDQILAKMREKGNR